MVGGTVKNAGGYTDTTITAFILSTQEDGNSIDAFNPQETSIEKGGSVRLTFRKNLNLKPGDYRMALAYLGRNDMWNLLSPFNPVLFEIKERPSAVDNIDDGSGITFYAAANQLYITSDNELKSVQLYDVSGKLHANHSVAGNQADIQISNMPKGIYLVAVSTVEGNKTFKFVKQ